MGQTIFAVCDSELVGKCITEGRLQLDLSSSFYKGEEMNEEDFKEKTKSCDMLNLAGERAVGIAVRLGLVKREHVLKIKGVPHAQVLNIRN